MQMQIVFCGLTGSGVSMMKNPQQIYREIIHFLYYNKACYNGWTDDGDCWDDLTGLEQTTFILTLKLYNSRFEQCWHLLVSHEVLHLLHLDSCNK